MPPPQDTNSAQVQITRGPEEVWKLTVIVTVLKCSMCTESFIFKRWLHIWRRLTMMCTHHTHAQMFTSSQQVLNGVRKTETLLKTQTHRVHDLVVLPHVLGHFWMKSWMNYVWSCDHSRRWPTVQWHGHRQTKEREPSGCRDFLKHISLELWT